MNTHHANVATMMLDADQLTMEFREYLPPHDLQVRNETGVVDVPSGEAIMAVEPSVRVVLTFSAAAALRAYLNVVMPKMERVRRGELL